jgi:hypothetical protein
MKKQIVQVSVLQSAKVIAGIYFVITVPIAALIALFALFGGHGLAGLMMAIGISLGYALGGFLTSLLGAWIYNLVAARVGGFEFQTVEVGSN